MVYSRNRLLKCIDSLGTALQRTSRYLQLDTVISFNTYIIYSSWLFEAKKKIIKHFFSRFRRSSISFTDIEEKKS